MRLNSVALTNFRQHADTRIDFDSGLTGVIGANLDHDVRVGLQALDGEGLAERAVRSRQFLLGRLAGGLEAVLGQLEDVAQTLGGDPHVM